MAGKMNNNQTARGQSAAEMKGINQKRKKKKCLPDSILQTVL